MNSRREFLQASSMALTAHVSTAAQLRQKAKSEAASQTAVQRDYWNDLPNYLTAKVGAARVRRKADLAKVTSAAEADNRSSLIRASVWELIGGELPRTALNPKVTGVVERQSYRIEKIIFESQPEFFVTANLYVPKSANRPFPGILAPVGHAPEGKAYKSYQTVFQNLARKGFAVLTWDPPGQGERLQYIDPATKRSLYGPTGEHDRFGWPALLVGSTTTQFEVWDGIRALDYLIGRPEIDAKRIGCCGHSGGGTQTMYFCALEPRINAAVVVEGNTENLAGANYQPPGAYADAEQNLIGGLKIPLDRGDLLCAFAPKPLLICYTPLDTGTTYSPHYVEGTEETFDELRNVYGAYGAGDKVTLSNSPLPHDYDYFQRRSTYQWFGKWFLQGQVDVREVDLEDAPESTLWCTSTGQVLTSIGARAAFQVNMDRHQATKTYSDSKLPKTEQVQTDLRQLLALPVKSSSMDSSVLSSNTYRDVVIEEFEYRSEPEIRVPGWFIKPATGDRNFPVVVVLYDEGRDGLFDEWPLVARIAHKGAAICAIDLRTRGATRPRLPSAGPLFYGDELQIAYSLVNLSLGVPNIGQETWDLLRCLDYLGNRKDVDNTRIGLLGTGWTGTVGLFAASLDQRVRSVLLNRTLIDFESIVASKEYELPLSCVAFGILKKFDLPEICATVAPRPVWFVNTVGPNREQLPLRDVQRRYQIVTRAYENANRPGQLSFRVEPVPIDNVMVEWLENALIQG
ncbi:MAG: acetylxylan esterase [Bryobacteraceae bacterium]